MKLDDLQKAMIAAMKAKDKPRKDSVSALVSAVKKAGIDAGCRDDIPEDMVNQVILKELKSVKEQIDTCPADRTELMAEYQARYAVMSEFAPKLLSADEVKEILNSRFAEVLATKNKGMIMKAVMAELKGKADGKVINQAVAELTR
ncbi:MAG: GatB/YqeY domain-containing protein [Clostridiales bacterium]|nr:GatB/YqeY domain-containing protein [Clostridiales bacterium]